MTFWLVAGLAVNAAFMVAQVIMWHRVEERLSMMERRRSRRKKRVSQRG